MQAGHRHDMADARMLQGAVQRLILVQVCPVAQQHGFHKMSSVRREYGVHFLTQHPVQLCGKKRKTEFLFRRNTQLPGGVGNEIDILRVIVIIVLAVTHVGGRQLKRAGDNIARLQTVQAAGPVIEAYAKIGAVIEFDLHGAEIIVLFGVGLHRGAQLEGLAFQPMGRR